MTELKRKVTLKRKEQQMESKKKTNWLIWLLLSLAIILFIFVLLLVRISKTGTNNAPETPAIEQPATQEKESATLGTPAEEAKPIDETSDIVVVPPVDEGKMTASPTDEPVEQTQSPSEPTTRQPDPSSRTNGVLEERAREVISGKYGNGINRKQALGTEYSKIQQKVNEMYRNGEVY